MSQKPEPSRLPHDIAQAAPVHWHTLSADEALTRCNSSRTGIRDSEAAQRLARYGPNALPTVAGPAAWRRFVRHFHNVLIYVLLGSATITALLGHLTDTLVILLVVIANAVIGYLQEGKAERAMEAVRKMLAPTAAVLRDGRRHEVKGSDLVPGDLVLLEAGDRVPADLRLVTAHALSVQEAILTGESLPVEKHLSAVAQDASLGDRRCMAYSGTLVTRGSAHGVVVASGKATEIGRISRLLADVESLTTPLVMQMDRFARWLTFAILLIAAGVLIFGHFIAAYPFSELFMAVVGLSVAAIPEGLPAVLTITLAIGVQAMARRHAIVRRLPVIETLGSVSVICTDKTGTLTRNEMMVTTALSSSVRYTVAGQGYAPRGKVEAQPATSAEPCPPDPVLAAMARVAALCNDAQIRELDGSWQPLGDPMEGALLAFAGKVDARWPGMDRPRSSALPFDAQHRFMATLHHKGSGQMSWPGDTASDAALISVKGAPERVLRMCDRQMTTAGETVALDAAYWHAQANELAARGQRVLALASGTIPAAQRSLQLEDVEAGLILVGMVGFIDPPRPEVIEAVAACSAAGIQVKMITGDHAGTASAIGEQIGLPRTATVLTGHALDTMDDAALARAVLDCDIYARTSPEHKLRLVRALQSHQLVVAMTGDGVNDAPALKRADAGVAMGRKGSEAAREAAPVVLADDNFASIVAAVREGRTVYDNIQKVISYTLPTSFGEATTIIIALLMGMTLPITPVQILWINLITATTLGLALAFEPTEPNCMRRPPRARNAPLLTADLVWRTIFISLLFTGGVFFIFSYGVARGYPDELSRTLALNTLVVMEIFNLFFIRNLYRPVFDWRSIRGTRIVWLTILLVTAAQLAVTYLPPFQAVLDTRSVAVADGLLIVAVGVVTFALAEGEKRIRLLLRGQMAA